MNVARRPVPLLRNQQIHRQRNPAPRPRAAFFLFPAGLVKQTTPRRRPVLMAPDSRKSDNWGLRLLSFSNSRFQLAQNNDRNAEFLGE